MSKEFKILTLKHDICSWEIQRDKYMLPLSNVIRITLAPRRVLLQKPAPLATDTDSFHEPQQADFCAG